MGLFRFDREGQIVAFEEKPARARLEEIGRSIPAGATFAEPLGRQAVHRVDGRVRLLARRRCSTMLARDDAKDFGREIIPAALGQFRVQAHLFNGYWADVGTVDSFYEANIMLTRPGAPFTFYDPRRPIYTHPRFLPGSRLSDCSVRDVTITARAATSIAARLRNRSSESARPSGRAPSSGDRCCSAPTFTKTTMARQTSGPAGHRPRRRPRPGHRRQERPHRRRRHGWSTSSGVQNPDGDGYFIRDGIIVVPKDGVITAGRGCREQRLEVRG